MDEPEWRRLNRANWDERVAIHLARDPTTRPSGCGRAASCSTASRSASSGPWRGCGCCICNAISASTPWRSRARARSRPGSTSRRRRSRRRAGSRPRSASTRASSKPISTRRATPSAARSTACSPPGARSAGCRTSARWAAVVASLLAPGGELYFADMHPAALIFDDTVPGSGGMPGWFAPYFHHGALVVDETHDYANRAARIANSRTHQFMHPVAAVVQALLDAGLRLTMLHEHDTLAWKAFAGMVETEGRLYRLPEKSWLPLSYSLKAVKM